MEYLFGKTREELISDVEWLLNALSKNEKFAKFIEAPRIGLFDEWRGSLEDCKIEVFSGQTKCVIHEPGADYVIKIPFMFYEDGAPMFDYCRAEARNFKVAMKEKVDDFFAACYKLLDYEVGGEYASTPIYIMEYVECNDDLMEDKCYSAFYESCLEEYGPTYTEPCGGYDVPLSDLVSEWYEDQENSTDAFLETQFKEGFIRFQDFCSENYINDIHSANIGIDRFGCVKVIDYSGYGRVSHITDKEWWDV